MATVVTRSLCTGEIVECPWQKLILPQLKQCEKKAFAPNEALDFDLELKKRSVTIVVIIENTSSPSTAPDLVAYLVLQHVRLTSSILLQKVCVSKNYRRQRVARSMLQFEINHLERRCSKILLWVRDSNTVAIELYKSLDFKKVSEVDDYYGLGQKGIQMCLDLWQA